MFGMNNSKTEIDEYIEIKVKEAKDEIDRYKRLAIMEIRTEVDRSLPLTEREPWRFNDEIKTNASQKNEPQEKKEPWVFNPSVKSAVDITEKRVNIITSKRGQDVINYKESSSHGPTSITPTKRKDSDLFKPSPSTYSQYFND